MARPLIIAHRGASAYAPENTRAAFELARDMGADGFECDVHLSKDGVPVVIHDENLKRLAGLNKRVRDLTCRKLKQLDVGSWFDRRFCDQRILTLEEALVLSKPRFVCMVEVKDSGDGRTNERLAREVAKSLKGARAMACSFNAGICAALKRMLPRLHVDWIAGDLRAMTRALSAQKASELGVNGLSADYRHLTVARVRQAHNAGLRVDAWTVNRAPSVLHLARLGVDAIETDKPDMALKALSAAGFTA